MPSFTITAANNSVTLDAAGTAQASFTVTNTTPEPVNGRLLAEAEDKTKPEWLSIVGDPAREFPANGAEQVTVQVAAPQGSPAGSYAFRLDAVAEANPDEDFTKGPSVAFDVAAPAPPKKKFPWWIVIVALVVIVGIGIAIWLFTKGGSSHPATTTATASVPDIMNQPADQAQTTLLNAGFAVRRHYAIADKSAWTLVITESPIGGSTAPQGSTVDITVGAQPSIRLGLLHAVTVFRP